MTEPEAYEDYKRQAPPLIAKFGGKYLVRGGHVESLEGDWLPERLVILEFPSVEQAKRWWSSADYALPKSCASVRRSARWLSLKGCRDNCSRQNIHAREKFEVQTC